MRGEMDRRRRGESVWFLTEDDYQLSLTSALISYLFFFLISVVSLTPRQPFSACPSSPNQRVSRCVGEQSQMGNNFQLDFTLQMDILIWCSCSNQAGEKTISRSLIWHRSMFRWGRRYRKVRHVVEAITQKLTFGFSAPPNVQLYFSHKYFSLRTCYWINASVLFCSFYSKMFYFT